MDNDDETKDYLEQLGYSISSTNPPCLILPPTDNQTEQQPINKLSQKLIKSKYQGNLKDVSFQEEILSKLYLFYKDYYWTIEYTSCYR